MSFSFNNLHLNKLLAYFYQTELNAIENRHKLSVENAQQELIYQNEKIVTKV